MLLFENMGLSPHLLTALEEMEFKEPTEVQEKTIPFFLDNKRDLIVLAQTGTGKTAAFGLPILNDIDPASYNTQALIISPTRELCMQITSDLKKYAKYLKGIRIVPVYGGASIMVQIRELKAGAHIIVATPGRLIDLIDRKAVKIQAVKTVVLDEADEMLNMGFREDMESILSHTPKEKVTGLFSATMSKEIRGIASSYLNSPEEITIGKKNTIQVNITHQYAVVQARDKITALKRIIDFHEDFYGIVFCNTKIETQEISDHLMRDGYMADCLHGDLAQAQRDKVMAKFRHKAIKVLLATDVAARGIDVKNLTHIIHYHLPDDIENYTHRSGRTARAGQKGISIALLHIKEAYKLHQIERSANLKFEKYIIPKGEDVLQSRVKNFTTAFLAQVAEDKEENKFPNEWVFPLMQLSKEELVQNILAIEFKKLNTHYTSVPDINVEERSKSGYSNDGPQEYRRSSRNSSSGSRGHSSGSRNSSSGAQRSRGDEDSGPRTRMFINLGKKDNIKYDEMREIIFQSTKISGRMIRDIEMKNVFSFFMTDTGTAKKLSAIKNAKHNGRELKILPASEMKDK